jgi:hypothetical protein
MFVWQFEKPESKRSEWNALFKEGIALPGHHANSGEPLLKCSKCSAILQHPYKSRGSTTTLNRHPCYKAPKPQDANQRSIESSFNGRTPREQVTSEMVRQEVLKFFITGNVAFAAADNQHFQNIIHWIKCIDGKEVSISRKVVRNMLSNGSAEARESLREVFKDLDSKVSLALDAWSSRNGYSFLGTFPCHTQNRVRLVV